MDIREASNILEDYRQAVLRASAYAADLKTESKTVTEALDKELSLRKKIVEIIAK